MSLTALVSNVASVTLHGRGPAASTEYIVPTTSVQANPIAAPVIGLDPTFPTIADAGTSVIPDFDRITKLPADLRLTAASFAGAGLPLPAAIPGEGLESSASSAVIRTKLFVFFITYYVTVHSLGAQRSERLIEIN
jgi:hypothetical protein